jgi:hypothetical protein
MTADRLRQGCTSLQNPSCSQTRGVLQLPCIESGVLSSSSREISREECGAYPPDEFVPERFLGDNPPIDPSEYAFGFGRRCAYGATSQLNTWTDHASQTVPRKEAWSEQRSTVHHDFTRGLRHLADGGREWQADASSAGVP